MRYTIILFLTVNIAFEVLSVIFKIYNGYIYFISAALIALIVINYISKLKQINQNLLRMININIGFIHISWVGFIISELYISSIYYNYACYLLYSLVLLMLVSKEKSNDLVGDFTVFWLGGFVHRCSGRSLLQTQAS